MMHQSVLLDESIKYLKVKPDGIYVDGTFGRGGHSLEILKQLTTGKLIAFDLDLDAILAAEPFKKQFPNTFEIVHENIANIDKVLAEKQISGIDGFLLDCGVSSIQFDQQSRGFSYRSDARLDMRMNQQQTLDAYQLVNFASIDELTKILKEYGEEPFAYKIACAIEKARVKAPIVTTFDLVNVIKSALPAKVLSKKGHPAKQSFQALRIAVNDELVSLKKAIDDLISHLNPEGIGVIISFHSLEDRIVKQAIKQLTSAPKTNKRIPQQEVTINFIDLTKKPIVPTQKEMSNNPRSESAKLRAIQRKA